MLRSARSNFLPKTGATSVSLGKMESSENWTAVQSSSFSMYSLAGSDTDLLFLFSCHRYECSGPACISGHSHTSATKFSHTTTTLLNASIAFAASHSSSTSSSGFFTASRRSTSPSWLWPTRDRSFCVRSNLRVPCWILFLLRFPPLLFRSEERRVGEEGRSRWAPDH